MLPPTRHPLEVRALTSWKRVETAYDEEGTLDNQDKEGNLVEGILRTVGSPAEDSHHIASSHHRPRAASNCDCGVLRMSTHLAAV
jgi:hypothetical protein